MEKLVAIVGPTGVGKSRIAVKVAEMIDAEIISCDSMQIYRGLNIGTAKILRDEMRSIPHYMLDIVNPDESFSVSRYQKLVQELITEINNRGRIPMLVGGTGLYYQVVVDDYQLEPLDTDITLRQALSDEADENGNEMLYQRLQTIDPEAAVKISVNDRKRIVRALEVIEKTGQLFSDFQKRNPGRYKMALLGLTMPREQLYQKIEQRVDQMIDQGLVHEVEQLLKQGYGLHLNSMQALGYAQMVKYLNGTLTMEETIDLIKRDSRRYAKRQQTWFKRDNRIKWLDLAEYNRENEIVEIICSHVAGQLCKV